MAAGVDFVPFPFVVFPMTAHPKTVFFIIHSLMSSLRADGLLLHNDGLKSLRWAREWKWFANRLV